MNTRPLSIVKGFLGKNNVAESTRFPDKRGSIYLSECKNVDIDDFLMVHRRNGYPSTPSLSGSGIHSLWADSEICLFVQSGDLKILTATFSPSTIKAGVGHSRMNYVRPVETIYLTNNSIIGYVADGVYGNFTAPDQTYKTIMKPGHDLEFFNGRLYVARGGEIWFSDPVNPQWTDERKNFKQFDGYITLMKGVKDGLYLSDGKKTYFMSGLDPAEASLVVVSDYPAYLGSAIKLDAEKIGNGDIAGMAIIWASPMGFMAGFDGGIIHNLTGSFYRPESSNEGSAILRQNGNYFQYLLSQKS